MDRELVRRMVEVLKAIQWSGDFCDDPACPECMTRYWRPHHPECVLAQAIRDGESYLNRSDNVPPAS